MKKLIFLIAVIAIAAAVGCSGGNEGDDDDGATTSPPPTTEPSPDPTFINAEGKYKGPATETTNTCKSTGARGLITDSLEVVIDQNDWNGGETVRVCFSAPSGLFWTENQDMNAYALNFCGTLDTTGKFLREGPDGASYYVRFSGMFMGEGGVANYMHSIDPYHLKLVIAANYCASGEGTIVINLTGEKE